MAQEPPHREGGAPEVLVIGQGVAGLSAARALAERGLKVRVVAKAPVERSNSYLAQGGVAAAFAADDSPALHAADTLAVGRGLNRRQTVKTVVAAGPAVLRELLPSGVFALDSRGLPLLDREAGHSRARIWHAPDGYTGRALTGWLWQTVHSHTAIEWEPGRVVRLITRHGRVVGAWVATPDGAVTPRLAAHVVLATGGLAGLWRFTTNPPETQGDGLWLAYDAGAVLADLEFVQFHPTVLAQPQEGRPALLLTEALRGFGAHLVDRSGRRILGDHPAGELAPRDEVARAVASHAPVYLSLRHLDPDAVHRHFPALSQALAERGLDLARDYIPVRPGAHFTMGGVLTDSDGRTTVPGLWAVGEVAMSGLHGANRLASNSLLEGLVLGRRVAAAVAEAARASRPERVPTVYEPLPAWEVPAELGELLDRTLSVFRTPTEMQALRQALSREASTPAVVLCRLMVEAALARTESRGSHWRRDAAEPRPEWRGHLLHQRERGMWFEPGEAAFARRRVPRPAHLHPAEGI
ncbi:MAG: FAD-dependent oxidoreductase [Firmicutes bacterium]|nr:FAD-dependent oxidoreductase [Alicyclobacillaceae bacterium]MCL6497140.1 FAD-dependent oxidoreductase [Bacillota bacterium]